MSQKIHLHNCDKKIRHREFIKKVGKRKKHIERIEKEENIEKIKASLFRYPPGEA